MKRYLVWGFLELDYGMHGVEVFGYGSCRFAMWVLMLKFGHGGGEG